MKRTITFIIFILILATAVYASDPVITYKSGDDDASKTKLKQGVTGNFTVTFNGCYYSDIGFSKTATIIGSSGLEKSSFTNSKLVMTRDTSYSGNGVKYDASFYVYWYISTNQAMTLSLGVENSATGATITINNGTEDSITVQKFGSYYAVYHGNENVSVSAVLTQYPDNNTVATLKLNLKSTS